MVEGIERWRSCQNYGYRLEEKRDEMVNEMINQYIILQSHRPSHLPSQNLPSHHLIYHLSSLPIRPIYVFGGSNYLVKMKNDCNFMNEVFF